MDQRSLWPSQLIQIWGFFDNMQFMNCSLDELVKKFTDDDLRHLSQEFSGDLLKLVKQKVVYPH